VIVEIRIRSIIASCHSYPWVLQHLQTRLQYTYWSARDAVHPGDMATKPQLTLWLWPEGLFPRRLSYYLLMKGIVSTPADLHAGKTTDPSLTIKLIRYTKGKGLVHDDPSDQPPKGASTPCLRIATVTSDSSSPIYYIYESISILLYFERTYTQPPALVPTSPLFQAQLEDRLALLMGMMDHGLYYLKHAVPQTSFWSGVPPEDRSLATARHAKQSMISSLVKLQSWCQASLSTTGYLTPGVELGPGLVDICLAAQVRYLHLCYGGYDLFEEGDLEAMKEWYARFKGACAWWDVLEEREDVHPQGLCYPKGCREI
jgi:glutathione S-transferase